MVPSDTQSSLDRQLVRLIQGNAFDLSCTNELCKLHLTFYNKEILTKFINTLSKYNKTNILTCFLNLLN